MQITIPDNILSRGTNATVNIGLVAAAHCPHGHGVAYNVPDLDQLDHYTLLAAEWAHQHANTCPGAGVALRAA